MIDSPVLPGRARGAAERARAGRLPGVGAAGHARRLGSPARAASRSPGPRWGVPRSTAARLSAEPRQAQRELREFDEEQYVERSAAAVAGGVPVAASPGQALDRPGAEHELELYPADGHTPDGTAFLHPVAGRAGVRRLPVAGRDPDGSRRGIGRAYLATLERLRALVERAQTVVPGPRRPARARRGRSRCSNEDVAYLDALARAGAAGAAARGPPDEPPSSAIHERSERRYSHAELITASVSPVATDAPTAIGSSATVPGLVRGDLVLHLHRLDHATSAPSSTAAPCSTATLSTVPWSGEVSVSPPPPPPPPARSLRRGARRAATAPSERPAQRR